MKKKKTEQQQTEIIELIADTDTAPMPETEKKADPTKRPKVASVISMVLLITGIIAFLISSLVLISMIFVGYVIKKSDYNEAQAEDTLETARYSAYNSLITGAVDKMTSVIGTKIDYDDIDLATVQAKISDKILTGVYEFDVVDTNGTVIASSVAQHIGFDLNSSENGKKYLIVMEADSDWFYVGDAEPVYGDESFFRVSSAALDSSGMVIYGMNKLQFDYTVANNVSDIVRYKHIGEDGYQMSVSYILEEDRALGRITCCTDEKYTKMYLPEIGLKLEAEHMDDGTYDSFITDVNKVLSFVSVKKIMDEEYLISVYPVREALASTGQDIIIITIIAAILFYAIYIALLLQLRKRVLDNLKRVNESLDKITNGDLNERVKVDDTAEFYALSEGINITVDKLKGMIEAEKNRMEEELEYARAIQMASLPNQFPAFPDHPEIELFATMRTAREVGGDLYDFYELSDGRILFYVADVSGKGIPAAMFMMRVKSLIKALSENEGDLAEIIRKTNESLSEDNDEDMFVTAWMGALDLTNGTLTYVNAGHNPPILLKSDGDADFVREAKANLVLGFMEGSTYDSHELYLAPGDTLFLYTDGVTEAKSVNNRLYGEDKLLRQFVTGNLCEEDVIGIIAAVSRSVKNFSEGAEQADDITMLAMRYL